MKKELTIEQIDALMSFKVLTDKIDRQMLLVERVVKLTDYTDLVRLFEAVSRYLNYIEDNRNIQQNVQTIRQLFEAEIRKGRAAVVDLRGR